jgi:hypothetical protein
MVFEAEEMLDGGGVGGRIELAEQNFKTNSVAGDTSVEEAGRRGVDPFPGYDDDDGAEKLAAGCNALRGMLCF